MDKPGFVYIIASRRHGTLYIGVTSDIVARMDQHVDQHRQGLIKGFASDYGVRRLVHLEAFDDMRSAIAREKRLKKWNRDWKIRLIEDANPDWSDLAIGLGFDPIPPANDVHGSPPARG